MAIAVMLSTALSTLLSAVILIYRGWRTTTIVFVLLLCAFVGGMAGKLNGRPTDVHFALLTVLKCAGVITLFNMTSLAISNYWIGWHRFRLIRLSKQESRQGA